MTVKYYILFVFIFICPSMALGDDCTMTRTYWLNHEEAWPALIDPYEVVCENKLIEILEMPNDGDLQLTLAQQYITIALNIENGATASVELSNLVAETKTIFESCKVNENQIIRANELLAEIQRFNNGKGSIQHCKEADVAHYELHNDLE